MFRGLYRLFQTTEGVNAGDYRFVNARRSLESHVVRVYRSVMGVCARNPSQCRVAIGGLC